MAHNEYYIFNQKSVNGQIMMSVQVFDEITKKTVSEIKNVSLDTSKGIQIPGTKAACCHRRRAGGSRNPPGFFCGPGPRRTSPAPGAG